MNVCWALGLSVAAVGIAFGTRRRRNLFPWVLVGGLALALAWSWGRTQSDGSASSVLAAPVVVSPVVVPPVLVSPVVVSPVVVQPVVVPPVVVQPMVAHPGAPPISPAELSDLVLDLRARTFGSDRLAHLRAEAERWTFTPAQAARIVFCFDFSDEKLGALEVLAPRLLPGDRGPLLDAFAGPFGEERAARAILGG